MPYPKPAWYEFHVASVARKRYEFDDALFAQSGNVIFANFTAARQFAQKMNAQRDLVRNPEQAVHASQVNAMGLVDEILHRVIAEYREQRNPQIIDQALEWVETQVGARAVNEALVVFTTQFPPLAVHRGDQTVQEYLEAQSTNNVGAVVSNRQIALEELLMLWLANTNPAFSPFQELFNDVDLALNSAYPQIIESLQGFFATQPTFGPDDQNLFELLRAPALAEPGSLEAQLNFLRRRWSGILGKFLVRLLSSLDMIKEETKPVFGTGGGEGVPAQVLEFGGLAAEPEQFSTDLDWMPKVVMIAKNAYVWLDQLSKKYKREITRLDMIPDEELDFLARAGITGLWLIGLWERSAASQRIKQLRGNPEAVASAYSLFSYEIAEDLGGDEAYHGLHARVWKRGIRLASDMVPNHMGIDSRWVIEHPDWFISLDYPPFPTYTFNGPNLSWDSRVGIYLEDHYYNNSDAAVVFKRVDFWTGSSKYIYHGNDGTSMPWNDTAQLNYLLPQVREAVIQTILHVARKFPIIRFDAAMTLAKRHAQRLWFPEPGTGGDIPSRAEFGLTKAQFDEAFPVEFWREVVDRVASEVPDTLLLAEAFWMMEGYFVRTLGMHRVYNSAFMNMLRDEKNQEYRQVIKNTIEFDPEILKRYVNFMNNPDERTAVDQFGKGDKYFGICTLMSTMPGLPMFGHGQVEGFTEKYGMEYRRAYWEEQPDPWLVERHQKEIFPLLRKRYLFAEVRDFLLFDFYTPEGSVNEDVFAYTNRAGDERTLVLYHNRYSQVRGYVRLSAAYPVKTGSGDERSLVQKTLGEGLGLPNDPQDYVIYRDHISGLEFLRNCEEVHRQGLFAELSAYQCHVFVDFRVVVDSTGEYSRLAAFLSGGGVPSMDEALRELALQPVLTPFRELANPGFLRWMVDNRTPAGKLPPETQAAALDELVEKITPLLEAIQLTFGGESDLAVLAAQIRGEMHAALSLPAIAQNFSKPRARKYAAAVDYLNAGPQEDEELASSVLTLWGPLLGWVMIRRLGGASQENQNSGGVLDEWLLDKRFLRCFRESGLVENAARQAVERIQLLTRLEGWFDPNSSKKTAALVLKSWLQNSDIQRYLGFNRYGGTLWYRKEAFDNLLWWAFAAASIDLAVAGRAPVSQPRTAARGASKPTPAFNLPDALVACYALILELSAASQVSAYQVERLLTAVED